MNVPSGSGGGVCGGGGPTSGEERAHPLAQGPVEKGVLVHHHLIHLLTRESGRQDQYECACLPPLFHSCHAPDDEPMPLLIPTPNPPTKPLGSVWLERTS